MRFRHVGVPKLHQSSKPARKLGFRTGAIASFLFLAGCPQQPVKPPVTEIPRAEPAPAVVDLDSDTDQNTEVPSESLPQTGSQWEKPGREIARTELSADASPSQSVGPDTEISVNPIPSEANERPPLEVARLEIESNAPESAIDIIRRTDPRALTRAERAEMLQIKADALRSLNLSIAALRTEAERVYLIEPTEQRSELQRILDEIANMPPLLIGDLGSGTDALAGLASAYALRGTDDVQRIDRWLRRFSDHALLDSNLSEYRFLTEAERPQRFHITVLLPLSGDLENAGRAIRDGILYAFSQSERRDELAFQFIDTHTVDNATLTKLRAGEDTEFVIGPLQKAQVARFLNEPLKIPALILNRLEPSVARTSAAPIYSLSLAIEDDASSAVAYAQQMAEAPKLLMLHQNDLLGSRAATAVAGALAQSAGVLVGQFPLDIEKPENTIADALGVTDSRNRRRELTRTLGLALEHTPRVRQDMTAVVVQTDPTQARQLRPLLDFYYLDDTPVILTGAYRSDLGDMTEDFKNSIVLATPWEMGSLAREKLSDRPITQGTFGTLAGIGKDAFDMTIRLGFGEPTAFQGETGFLSLGPQAVINRRLGKVVIDEREQVAESLWSPDAPPMLQEVPDA